jgi:hypothetical protein
MTQSPHLRMRRRLEESVGDPIWPEGMHLNAFADGHAAEVHALLELAYAAGGGSSVRGLVVVAFKRWRVRP